MPVFLLIGPTVCAGADDVFVFFAHAICIAAGTGIVSVSIIIRGEAFRKHADEFFIEVELPSLMICNHLHKLHGLCDCFQSASSAMSVHCVSS